VEHETTSPACIRTFMSRSLRACAPVNLSAAKVLLAIRIVHAGEDESRANRHGVKIALSRTRYCSARGSLSVALVVYSFPCMRAPPRAIHGASILSARPSPPTIDRLMDCDTKWRQSVSSFSCLYRRNLRHAYCSTVPRRQTGTPATMHNGIQPKQASKRSVFPPPSLRA